MARAHSYCCRLLHKINHIHTNTQTWLGVQQHPILSRKGVMVFSNQYPDIKELSKDRWIIFKIVDDELIVTCGNTNKKKQEAKIEE